MTCTATDRSGLSATASFTVTVNVCGPCPAGLGSWKKNSELWPVDWLMLGHAPEAYFKSDLLTLLNTEIGSGNKADASLILGHQLVAAKLNIAKGANPCLIADAITAADALIGARRIPILPKVTPNSELGRLMVALAAKLDDFNNGLLSPGCGL